MKKMSIFVILFLLFIPKVNAEETMITNARSGVLIEASTGEVLYEKNKDEKLSVASLTKMMVQLIVLEKIEDGSIKWDDVIVTSSNASGMGGTQIWLSTGEKMTVKDLFKGMSIVSANDATVALAEYISGSEKEFVKLMNKKAKELGLKNTNFVNSTGLDEKNHYSSAYDLALLAKQLISHEEIFNYSSLYEDYIRVDTPNKFWLVNTNKLIRFYDGADGLKTGFTDDAMYTIAATAKRDEMRLIAIVLGEKEGKVRNSETMELLNYGFNNYKIEVLKKKGEVIDNKKISKANRDSVNIVLKDDLTILNKKTDREVKYEYDVVIDEIKLPIKKNNVVGKINLLDNNKILKSADLVVENDIYKVNYFKYIFNELFSII